MASGGHVLGCPADPAGKSRLGKRSGERVDDTTQREKVKILLRDLSALGKNVVPEPFPAAPAAPAEYSDA